jgi:hypothetical protein
VPVASGFPPTPIPCVLRVTASQAIGGCPALQLCRPHAVCSDGAEQRALPATTLTTSALSIEHSVLASGKRRHGFERGSEWRAFLGTFGSVSALAWGLGLLGVGRHGVV